MSHSLCKYCGRNVNPQASAASKDYGFKCGVCNDLLCGRKNCMHSYCHDANCHEHFHGILFCKECRENHVHSYLIK